MPKETFLKLSKDKKDKILNAAKKEFSRVSIEKVSIKNIVEEAGIARGSFYQYFENKEDLLYYIVSTHVKSMNENMEKKLKENHGDIIDWYIILYDCMVKTFKKKDEINLYKKIFENIKASDEKSFAKILKEYRPTDIFDYYELLDKTKLNVKSKEDLKNICGILNIVTRHAVIESFQFDSDKQAKENFLQKLEYIKYGILKRK